MRPRTDRHTDVHRRTWPQYISRGLRLTRNVIITGGQSNLTKRSTSPTHMDASDGTMSCLFPPSNMPLPMGDLDLHLMVPRAHPSPQPKWHLHLDRFIRFCRAHNHDRQTDRPTNHTIVCKNRPHLRTAMRPNNNKHQLSMTNLCNVLHHDHLHYMLSKTSTASAW